MNVFNNSLSNDLCTNIIQQMKQHTEEKASTVWAIRDINGKYIHASSSYTKTFVEKPSVTAHTLNDLMLDNASIMDIIDKDQRASQQNILYKSSEVYIVRDKLFMAKVERYPLVYQTGAVAIGTMITPEADLEKCLTKYRQNSKAKLDNNVAKFIASFRLRDKLLGAFVLFGLSIKEIAELLQISVGRVSSVLSRICWSKFGVGGRSKLYHDKLISLGMYKQILRELYNSEYKSLLLKAYYLSNKASTKATNLI